MAEPVSTAAIAASTITAAETKDNCCVCWHSISSLDG